MIALNAAVLTGLVACFGHDYTRVTPIPADMDGNGEREALIGELSARYQRQATAPEQNQTAAKQALQQTTTAFAGYAHLNIRAGSGAFETNRTRLQWMYGSELTALQAAKAQPYSAQIGLALSGGGVRSASFATGVLQGLHESGVLPGIGYLSTVSGGGYAAAWFMTHCRTQPQCGGRGNAALFEPGSEHLFHLSQYGTYLGERHAAVSVQEYVSGVITHLAYTALYHWTCNGICDYKANASYWKTAYRRGIHRAYQYDEPLKPQTPPRQPPSMAQFGPTQEKPLWIINMHLSLLDDDSHFKARSGDAFELTPYRAGGSAVGYVKVESNGTNLGWDELDDHYWMTPYYAVPISGAAIDGASGLQNKMVENVLYFSNLNMGYHVNGWGSGWLKADSPRAEVIARNGAYYFPLLFPFYGLQFGHARDIRGKRYYLTDGGHFDNTGAYALIRRGVRVLIVSDGTYDAHIAQWCANQASQRHAEMALAFDDLRILEERIYADFGLRIRWDWERLCENAHGSFLADQASYVVTGLSDVLPTPAADDGHTPVERIRIVYIKSAFDAATGLSRRATFVDAEHANHPTFPNETTADQSFTEREVLSYREVARRQIEPGSRGHAVLMEALRGYCAEQGQPQECLRALNIDQ